MRMGARDDPFGDTKVDEHLRIIDVFDERLEAARKRIGELEREFAELRAKYKALHQRQFKPNRKKNAACEEKAADRPPVNKKRGAPVGHPGWFRPRPAEIDPSVHVAAPQRDRNGDSSPTALFPACSRQPEGRAFAPLHSSKPSSLPTRPRRSIMTRVDTKTFTHT
jgi:hypothetical protein